MRMVDLIFKKRENQELSTEEINYIVDGYSKDKIPDYQMSAFAMAVFFKGMSKKETADFTMAMVESGDKIDLSSISGKKVDKHSTGGVGDTTTLVLGPLVAAVGVPVAKMSGRGLGHTGGTIDKLEAIQGLKVELSNQDFISQVNRIKLAVIGQTAKLTPADKKLYALRDVTSTIDSIPLIASSIMSKKIAAGADGIVLDVKTGDGAFMKSEEKSFELAKAMVDIGILTGKDTVAIISDMNQPLGYTVGNSLEVKEAIETLKGNGPKDLEELCLVLGSHMLVIGEKAKTVEEGYQLLKDIIKSGKALETLKRFVKAQGGKPDVIDNTDLLPKAANIIRIVSRQEGYVHKINAQEIGFSAMLLGAGRETKESNIDLAVGIVLNKKIGEFVSLGEVIATLHVNNESNLEEVKRRIVEALYISNELPKKRQLIYGIVTKNGIERY